MSIRIQVRPLLCGFTLCATLLLAAIAGAGGALASTPLRAGPPEPSRIPWVTRDSVFQLEAAISQYRAIAAAGGWPRLPNRTLLKPGDNDQNVAILRRRLQITGDLRARSRDEYAFDEALRLAVMNYQRRNGLEPNGIVYGITQRSLSVSVQDRLRQLERNLERIRVLAPAISASPRHILMNAASFELQGISGGRVEITSRTIAGKRRTPTPAVSSAIRAINILPYWHVPGTIAQAALIPAVRKDPGYLYRERIRVFSSFGGEEVDPSKVNWWGPEATRFVFRQDPGPHNALGLLRFDMPNKHIVYMHDTPMKKLFGYFERAYSAGCVRVQNFYALADWVLAGQDNWNSQRLQSAAAGGKGLTIKVARPVPVHFIYLTAWIENGIVQFRNDLYNRDEGQFTAGEDVSSRVLSQAIAP
jgi:murein L,D-transpeptidase YcbB/YkuD